MENKKENIAKIIYEEVDRTFIIHKTKWEDLASFNKKQYLDIAGKIIKTNK
jgi:hypothetical protein